MSSSWSLPLISASCPDAHDDRVMAWLSAISSTRADSAATSCAYASARACSDSLHSANSLADSM